MPWASWASLFGRTADDRRGVEVTEREREDATDGSLAA